MPRLCQRGLVRLLYQRSGGNPLFFTALVDELLQRGILEEAVQPSPCGRRMAIGRSIVPDSIHLLITQQVEQLSSAGPGDPGSRQCGGDDLLGGSGGRSSGLSTCRPLRRGVRPGLGRAGWCKTRDRDLAGWYGGGVLWLSSRVVSRGDLRTHLLRAAHPPAPPHWSPKRTRLR